MKGPTVPLNLVLVRHGESEGNAASTKDKEGDDGAYTQEFMGQHNSWWRLTAKGETQAREAGKWLSENFEPGFFDRLESSQYARAMQTAALLGIQDVEWRLNDYLRERDRGIMDVITTSIRDTVFGLWTDARKKSRFYAPFPGGESMSQLCERFDRVMDTLVRSGSQNVLLVCHGELMWAARVRIERLRSDQFDTFNGSKDPLDKIHNCQIIHYTRQNPETGAVLSHFGWVRSICPWDTSLSTNEWCPIVRKTYTSESLLTLVDEMYPQA
ncbi:histidine phosphatase family protein [bacterium]|uniref:phosphoglycerate mutase (2,3-diphosphoglycerate-dependent) n=2 Tax=Katanobacteria TaxID=422282 RepID=A0A2M7X2S1_UNCKA|nr:histidine phosphatase family protein [bacterium]PIP56448.1 MAG: hypothetical protein COX05_02990 [candidate division WWE3 bacterium CG22_combo_CG10-13_8_21_14_all_39_12]PJA40473.1 MAG: hypothetical protein CO179_02230 [candidate division WWE3 bacterium CG_4_9_14_3_um_filter_39_7]